MLDFWEKYSQLLGVVHPASACWPTQLFMPVLTKHKPNVPTHLTVNDH